MTKLRDFYKEDYSLEGLGLYNIFDELIKKNIKEIEVNREEMYFISNFFIANAGQSNLGAKVLRTGKLDMIKGIKLNLI